MKFAELTVNKRTGRGNGPARQLRREGMIPAVIYGPGKDAEMLSVPTHELELLLKRSRSSQMLFNLTVKGAEGTVRPAMIKDLHRDPLSHAPLHVDFYEFDPSKKIHVNVPVVPKGRAEGVEMGGMLQVIRRELEVLCLPGQIPDAVEIDVTGLQIGGAIHVQDISLQGGLEIPHEVNFTVITCLGHKAETEEEGEEGAAEETTAAEA